MEPKAVFTSLDKADLEELIRAWNDKLIEATDKWRYEEKAKEAYHDEVRHIVKKVARFVELWEEADAKERASEGIKAAENGLLLGA